MTPPRLGKGLHLHFDPISGIAGDMTVAALVHAGVPEKIVFAAIDAMGVRGLKVSFEPRRRGAFLGLGFVVNAPLTVESKHPSNARGKKHLLLTPKKDAADAHDHGHAHDHDHVHGDGDPGHAHAHDHSHDRAHGSPHAHGAHSAAVHIHRPYAEIRRLLRTAPLEGNTRKLAGAMFERVATVEAELHGMTIDEVTFHEVGAWDSIADIVGAAAAVAWLEPSQVTSSPPVLGSGSLLTAHGYMPIPAPATAAILRGIPVCHEGKGELTTPTGAAILAALVHTFGPPPAFVLQAQGFGAGTRDFPDRSNVLRVLLGEPIGKSLPPSTTEILCLSANLDDMNPQLVEPLMTELFAAGALDVWITPIQMKKGRPAFCVSALCELGLQSAMESTFFTHSTTLGVRRSVMQRTVLDRAMIQVKIAGGEVRAKIASRDGTVMSITPEFEDCRRMAKASGIPVRQALDEAWAAAQALKQKARGPKG